MKDPHRSAYLISDRIRNLAKLPKHEAQRYLNKVADLLAEIDVKISKKGYKGVSKGNDRPGYRVVLCKSKNDSKYLNIRDYKAAVSRAEKFYFEKENVIKNKKYR